MSCHASLWFHQGTIIRQCTASCMVTQTRGKRRTVLNKDQQELKGGKYSEVCSMYDMYRTSRSLYRQELARGRVEGGCDG